MTGPRRRREAERAALALSALLSTCAVVLPPPGVVVLPSPTAVLLDWNWTRGCTATASARAAIAPPSRLAMVTDRPSSVVVSLRGRLVKPASSGGQVNVKWGGGRRLMQHASSPENLRGRKKKTGPSFDQSARSGGPPVFHGASEKSDFQPGTWASLREKFSYKLSHASIPLSSVC